MTNESKTTDDLCKELTEIKQAIKNRIISALKDAGFSDIVFMSSISDRVHVLIKLKSEISKSGE